MKNNNLTKVFLVLPDSIKHVLKLLDKGSGQDWTTALQYWYLPASVIPTQELLNPHNEAEAAMLFIKYSKTDAWRTRQMRPLDHLDLMSMGDTVYMFYDKLSAPPSCGGFTIVQIPESKNLILLNLYNRRIKK